LRGDGLALGLSLGRSSGEGSVVAAGTTGSSARAVALECCSSVIVSVVQPVRSTAAATQSAGSRRERTADLQGRGSVTR
jgi:hypothetical protein